MSTFPTTWPMLQAIQQRVQSEVLLNATTGIYDPAGVSPFDLWSSSTDPSDATSDLARYGQSNPYGACPNAIYIGNPKEFKPKYTTWAEVVPVDESVYRRAIGGKIWHETFVYFRVSTKYLADWFAAWKTITCIGDAAHTVMAHHAELPNVQTVMACKEELSKSGMPTGFYFDEIINQGIGRAYISWAAIWWHKMEFNVGPIVP